MLLGKITKQKISSSRSAVKTQTQSNPNTLGWVTSRRNVEVSILRKCDIDK